MRNRILFRLPAIWLVVLLATTASIAAGAQFAVNTSEDLADPLPGDGQCTAVNKIDRCTLRGAIQEANAFPGADSIIFNIPTTDDGYNPQTGIYTLILGTLPDITNALTISHSDPNKLVVSRPSNGIPHHIFNITASGTVNLTGITIKRGDVGSIGGSGGGVRNAANGTVNVTNVVFDTNFAAVAGGAFCNAAGGSANFSQVVFKNNYANFGGGIGNTGNGTVTIQNCTFDPNSAQNGGGVANTGSGTVTITGSTFTNNTGFVNGAAIYSASGTLNVTGANISNNVIRGGPNGSQFFGAGIYLGGGAATVAGSTISGNKCEVPPPAQPPSPPQLTVAGGGIANTGANLAVTNCNIFGNTITAPGATSGSGLGPGFAGGGGIYSTAPLTLTSSTVADNSATGGPAPSSPVTGFKGGDAFGGGVYASGTTNISNCTLADNAAIGGAGNANHGGSAHGGGICVMADLNLSNTTIVRNSATAGSPAGSSTTATGGGVFVSSPSPAKIKSSIVALDSAATSGPDVFGAFSSLGYNLVGKIDGSNGLGVATDLTGTAASPLDPQLNQNGLQNNGGPTQTIALLPGSPAIDKGTSVGLTGHLTTDQRGAGFPRIVDDGNVPNAGGGDGADIGAFELQTAQPTPTSTPVTTLANISTRLRVETGDNVLIGGFIVTGTQPKKVIVRAIGPSLPLADELADPTLELHGPNGLIEASDNWMDSANKQAIIDSTIPPGDNLESAIVAMLPANNAGYTAIVREFNGGTGIGVVEAYDLDQAADSKLANISTRGLVQTGDNVLIAGTIVIGETPQRVIIRAIGPSLPIAGAMANPTLELRNFHGDLIEANDNWVDSPNKQAIIDTTIPPTNDLESAVVQTLPANGAQYTAIVRGVNDSTGIAVVEVYALN